MALSVDRWVVNIIAIMLTTVIMVVALASVLTDDFKDAPTIILTLGGIIGTVLAVGGGSNGKNG